MTEQKKVVQAIQMSCLKLSGAGKMLFPGMLPLMLLIQINNPSVLNYKFPINPDITHIITVSIIDKSGIHLMHWCNMGFFPSQVLPNQLCSPA